MSDITDTRIAFVGGGAMAEAFIGGLLAKGLAAPQRIIASDPLPERRRHLAGSLGIATTASNREAVRGADVVVLAVKPQVAGRVLEDLAGGELAPEALLMTFVAGVRIATLRAALGERKAQRVQLGLFGAPQKRSAYMPLERHAALGSRFKLVNRRFALYKRGAERHGRGWQSKLQINAQLRVAHIVAQIRVNKHILDMRARLGYKRHVAEYAAKAEEILILKP